MTNRQNQENFISTIRRSGGNRDNPTCEEFISAFKQCIIDSILTPSKGSNCLGDGDTIVSTLADFHSIKSRTTSASHDLSESSASSANVNGITKVNDISETLTSLLQQNVLTYIAGHILYKLEKNHGGCVNCNFLSVKSAQVNQINVNEQFCHLKSLTKCGGNFGGLTIPSACFYHSLLP